MTLLCAALGHGKHGVTLELVLMSVQQKLQGENIRKIKQRFVQCWGNEGILAEDMCFDYFTVQTNEV